MATFSEMKSGLDAISDRIRSDNARMSSVKADAQFVVDDLTNLGNEYSALVTAITAAADAAPSDVALQNAKAESAQLVAEFNALSTKAAAVVTAAS